MTIIDIKPMKEKAIGFPDPVKSLILREPDNMDSIEFIAKLATWERLIRMANRMAKNK